MGESTSSGPRRVREKDPIHPTLRLSFLRPNTVAGKSASPEVVRR